MPFFAPSKKDLYQRKLVSLISKFAQEHNTSIRELGRVVDIAIWAGDSDYDRVKLNADAIYGSVVKGQNHDAAPKDITQLLSQLDNPFTRFSIIVTNRIQHLELCLDADKNLKIFTKIGPSDEISVEALQARDDFSAKFVHSLIEPLQAYLACKAESEPGCVNPMASQ